MNPSTSAEDDLLEVPNGDPAKFCRLCLSEINVEELFPDGQGARQDVIDRIFKCTGIEITFDEDYPSAVCWMCSMSLEEFQWFRERCHRYDVLIRQKRKQLQAEKERRRPVSVVPRLGFQIVEDDDGDYDDDDDDDEPDGPVLRISSVQENVQTMDDGSLVVPQSFEPAPEEEQDVKPNAEALAAFAAHFMAGGGEEAEASSDTVEALSTSDGERRFKCNQCSRTFKNRANLWEHNRLHQGNLPFSCQDCGTTFSRVKSLEAHRLKYHSKDSTEDPPLRLQCRYCPRVFPRKGDRTQHMKMGHPDLYDPYEKNEAATPTLSSGRETPASSLGGASSAILAMPEKKTIVPIKKPPASSTPVPRRRTLLANTGQEGPNLNCTICTKLFPSIAELDSHVSQEHPIGSIMSCPFCPKTFKSRQTIRMHILNHQGKLPFKCEDCDARFDRKFYLMKHRERYHQEGEGVVNQTIKCRFKCKFCPRIFLRKIDRKTHTRLVHQAEIKIKKEKPDPDIDGDESMAEPAEQSNSSTPNSQKQTEISFGCLQCGMQFRSAEKLRNHTITQHLKKDVKPVSVANKVQNPRPIRQGLNTRRPFKCPYCPKTFTQKYVMKEHTFIHTGSLRYPCDICMAMFNRPHYLRAHKQKYHSENSTFKAIKCRFCTRTFVRKQDIKIHERVAHSVTDYDDASVQREIFETSQNGSLEEGANLSGGGVEGNGATVDGSVNSAGKVAANQAGGSSVLPYTIDEDVDDFDGDDDDDYMGEENGEDETSYDIPENPEIRDVVVTLERIPDEVLETLDTSYDDYEEGEEDGEVQEDGEANGDGGSESNRTDTPRLNMSITLHRCPKCQKVFKTLKSLKHHMIYHQTNLPFACDECGVQFARNRPLQIHKEKYHSEDAPYQGQRFSCDYCPRIFLRDRDKLFHMKIVHSMERGYRNREDGTPELKKAKIKKRKDYVCLTCCERFETEKACQRHINQEHPDEDSGEKISCDSVIPALLVTPKLEPEKETSEAVDTTGKLDDIKTTIPEPDQPPPPPALATNRPYKLCRCTICVSTFKNRDNWEDHLQNHPNVRPHHCEACLIKRKSRSNRKVTSVGFKCQHCPKVFTKANTLRTHSRLHTSELRFPCDECGMMYDRYRLLQAHKDKYHSEDSYMHPPLETFRCQYCPRTFMRQRDCNFHQESVHAV